jgi:DNA-binding transcriptional LysR family regulator
MRGHEFAQLRAFATVAEQASFTRAAAHLHMTPSALSQTIRVLEDRLEVRLLNRTTRSVSPTSVGEELLSRLRPLLADFDTVVDDLKTNAHSPAGIVRINMPRIVAYHLITPHLGEFNRRFPEITLDITLDNDLRDIVAGGYDAGIRLGESLEGDMIAIRLGPAMQMVAVAAPDYLATHGIPETPRDLAQHKCLNLRSMSTGVLHKWEFERALENLDVLADGPLVANDSALLIEAACQGMGIAMVMALECKTAFANNQLVRILEDFTPPFGGFYIYHASRHQVPPALRAFIDFFCSANRNNPGIEPC